MRHFKIIAFVLLGATFLLLPPGALLDCAADTLPKGLPSWFKELDKDRDAQVSLAEWRQAGRTTGDFHKLDRNSDGLLTPEEVLWAVKKETHLKLEGGEAKYQGTIEKVGEPYQGKQFYKVLTIDLAAGKTYQVEMVSQAHSAFVFVEGPEGQTLTFEMGANPMTVRVTYRVDRSGTYRITATSQSGARGGPFTLTVRLPDAPGSAAKALPPWFKPLDIDRDGQVSLREWRQGGRPAEEFHKLDRNGDGLVTRDEAILSVQQSTHLKPDKGQAKYDGVAEAHDDQYLGKTAYKALTVDLQAGKTYQFEQSSQVYASFLYLVNPDGEVVAQQDGGGMTARLVHRPARSGTYRLIATSQGGFRTGPFSLTIRVVGGPAPIKGLPPWFRELDKDRDEQVSLLEWQRGGRKSEEFQKYDLNDDGVITANEALRVATTTGRLKLVNGKVRYEGKLEPTAEEKYQSLKYMKILTVELEAEKTYVVEHSSKAFEALMGLEDPSGQIVAFGSGGGGAAARFVHRATRDGLYRILATSQNGTKPGAFSLTIRALTGDAAPKATPQWFKELDGDRDEQVALSEWRKAGRKAEEFHKLDRNGDGILTTDEISRASNNSARLKFEGGEAKYDGDVEMASEPYQFRRAYKVLTVDLRAGKTYQFEQVSKVYWAFLFLEAPGGEVVAQQDGGGNGQPARVTHRPAESGTYRIIATSSGGFRTGPFSLTVRDLGAGRRLPPEFKELDKDRDGQVSLREWRMAGRAADDFRKLDRNGDGFLAPEEVSPAGQDGSRLKLEKGETKYQGSVETNTEPYQFRQAYKALTVELQAGKTYQFEQSSQSYASYLLLENPDGEVVAQQDGGGMAARLVHRPARSGTYRIIATSQAGFRTGPFVLTARTLDEPPAALKGLPPWFKGLDKDQDGQVSLREWRTAGRTADDFQQYDLNSDGFITPPEVLRYLQRQASRLKQGMKRDGR